MKSSGRRLNGLALAALMMFVLACGLPLQSNRSITVEGTPKGESSPSNENRVPLVDGNLLLPKPDAGLASLKSYHVSFQQDVTGATDGKPFERHTRLELTRSAGQADFISEQQNSDGTVSYARAIVLDQVVYRWQSASQACQAEPGDPQTGEILEPAKLLLPIRSASRMESETVNQIQTIHYRFDQKSLGLTVAGSSLTGDVWLAEAGGYVVRYMLSQVPAQKWTYDLSLVDEGGAVALPEDCIEVPFDLPVLPDAKAVTRSSGWLDYMTSSTAAQTANFYLQKLPGLGWTTLQKELKDEPRLPYAATFTRENRHLSLSIEQGKQNGLEVTLFIFNPKVQAVEVTASPKGPEPTVDPASSGLADDVPLYKDATGLIHQGDTMLFNAPDNPEIVAKFYKEQMAANSWVQQSETVVSNVILQTWQKANRSLTITIGTSDGVTYVAVTSVLGQ